ncbi:MAG: hypothetical protein AB8D52_12575 [Gammaproteobacteria bacterium]
MINIATLTSISKQLLILCSLLIISTSNATTVRSFNVNDLLSKAEFVFEGEVIASKTGMDANDHWIVTDITFQINDVVKGADQGSTIELRFVGGEYNGKSVRIPDMKYPAPGEKGIYFVESLNEYLINPLLGWTQGHYVIETDQNGVERVNTAEGEQVENVESNIPNEDLISDGTAAGLRTIEADTALSDSTSTSSATQNGMTPDEFKQKLKEIGW